VNTLDAYLTTQRIGRDYRFLPSTSTTNREVDALGACGAHEGVVIAADVQTAGRGRMARSWFSPPGVNLCFSMLLRPEVDAACAVSLPLVVGLSVAEAVAECAPMLHPQIKWPNDILVNGKKLCGILCEMQADGGGIRYIVAGIGVNVNLTDDAMPAALRGFATSMRMETGRMFQRDAVLGALLNHFERDYDLWRSDGLNALLARIQRRDALDGQFIRMELAGTPIEGIASGIQADGALLLATSHGLIPVYSGEAHLLK